MTKSRIKTPNEILDDFDFKAGAFSRDNSAVVLDTGAVIDVIHSTRSHDRICREQGVGRDDYVSARSLFSAIGQNSRLVVLPSVYVELMKHSNSKINHYTREIDEDTRGLIEQLASDSFEYMSLVDFTNFCSFDEIRYDVHNTTLEACNGCSKKQDEGYSMVDKDILLYSGLLTQGHLTKDKETLDLKKVTVLSSDRHVLCGVDFMVREFSGKYNKLFPVSTRIGVRNGI
ncbi:MAG TPA: hypothetical protein VI815_00080 [Candidatus Nanoarchaeia archaeon]|nr:hypothetical protein [Candidatus Nanoarchaeia archaeon]